MAFDGALATTRIAQSATRRDYLHVAIFLADGRILDDRTFRLVGFNGQESVSNPFEFQLQLHGNTDPENGAALSFADIVGRPVTFAVRRAVDANAPPVFFADALATGQLQDFALFNGIAASFSMAEPGVYNLSVKAALWKLNLTNRYTIYAQKCVRDVIAAVLERHDIACDMKALPDEDKNNPAVARVQDWLQAGESDYAFVARLMAKAHLYYYAVHGPAGHTLVFANAPHYRDVFSDGRALRYTWTGADELGLSQNDVISAYSYEQTLTSSAVNGVFARQENAWEEDAVARYATFHAAQPNALGDLPFQLYKIYQYGCDESEVARFTDATARCLASAASQLSGSSLCPLFRTGYRFALAGPVGPQSHPDPVRPTLSGRRFVLTQLQHQATLDGGYHNEFHATEDEGLITPFSLQDTHQGSLLAKVVGDGHGTEPTGWEYCHKTDFVPGQTTYNDNGSGNRLNAKGVYVQFSTPAGPSEPVFVKLAPHMQTVPELGVTVLVSRANDESELPEIQSIVQTNGNKVVMPSGWTANTQVGSNFSTSYGDSKSVRFGKNSLADVDAAVQLIEREYDTGQYRDASYAQGASYSYATSENGRNGLLSTSDSFGSTYNRHQAQETKSWSDVDYSFSDSQVGRTENYSTVRQDSVSYQTVVGTSYGSSTLGRSESYTTIKGDSISEHTVQGNTVARSTVQGTSDSYNTVNGKSYNESTFADMESHTTVNGASRSYHTSNGLSYNESTVNGDATSLSTITGTSTNTSTVSSQIHMSTVGLSSGTNIMGLSQSTNVTGMSSGSNVTGVSSNVNVLGASSDVSVTGAHQRLSVTGASMDLSLTGASLSIAMVDTGIEISTKAAAFRSETVLMELELPAALKMVL